MPRVFISHATADRAVVTRDIIDVLKDHGIDSWIAEDDIVTAREWERSILDGLNSCDWFLIALTPRAVQSEWVKDEVHWAIEERPGRIVPVLIEDCNARDIHIRLPRIQNVDFRSVDDNARRRLLACWDIEYRPAARFHVRFNALHTRYKMVQRVRSSENYRVYFGRDTLLNRPVIIKCDAKEYPKCYDRILNPVVREALAVGPLFHQSIPRVFDLAEDPELGPYSIVEYVPGDSLKNQMEGKSNSIDDCINLMTEICHVVQYANDEGVIHRDIKPGNILIAKNGQPYLTNFTLAILPGECVIEGALTGSVRYMAPEQVMGFSNVDARIDVWALGVVLYELLTGELPFHRAGTTETAHDSLKSILKEQPTPMRHYSQSVPEVLERICLNCLEKKRKDRYATALDLATDLSMLRNTGRANLARVSESKRHNVRNEAYYLGRIQKHPDDPALRLEFAYWLDDQGDPRGELLRIQELLRNIDVPDRPAKETRMQELLKEGVAPLRFTLTNSIGMEFVLIFPGEFMMGKRESESRPGFHQNPVPVTLTQPFYLGRCVVTQTEWLQVMKTQPWLGKHLENELYPATFVDWDDAKTFCGKLNEQSADLPEGWIYKLPSEAQWEYACRAGTTTHYSFGDDRLGLHEHTWSIEDWSSFAEQQSHATYQPHPVGQKRPNPWGIHDMHSNVFEWCHDFWRDEIQGGIDPEALDVGRIYRAYSYRGGSVDFVKYSESTKRFWNVPETRYPNLGFRVAATLTKPQSD